MTSGLCTAAASLLFWSPWQSLCQILISAAALSKCRNGKLVLEFCQGYFDICNVCSGCGSQWECCWLSFLRQAVCLSVGSIILLIPLALSGTGLINSLLYMFLYFINLIAKFGDPA